MKQNLLFKSLFVLAALLFISTRLQAQQPYAVLSDGGLTVTFYYDTQKANRGGVDINSSNLVFNFEESPYGTATTAIIDASFASYHPTSTAYWFQKCLSLTSITDIENLNTANVTNMSWMFYDCRSLTSLDVSNFNTANVTDMSWLFSYCRSLTSLDLSNFNTAKVTDMGSMFSGLSSLTSLDVSNFNTANVTDMSWMFYYCRSLTSLDRKSVV